MLAAYHRVEQVQVLIAENVGHVATPSVARLGLLILHRHRLIDIVAVFVDERANPPLRLIPPVVHLIVCQIEAAVLYELFQNELVRSMILVDKSSEFKR